MRVGHCIYRTTLLTLKALPRQWVALETANLQSLRSRMLTSVSPFFLMSLVIVSMYLNFGLPLGHKPSTTMSSTVLVLWLSYRRLTCPYQLGRHWHQSFLTTFGVCIMFNSDNFVQNRFSSINFNYHVGCVVTIVA